MKKSWIITGIVIIALYGAYRFYAASMQHQGAPAVNVNVTAVIKRDVDVRVQALGTVQPFSSVEIKSMITGQLEKVGFREGDLVKKDQVLFEIDPRPFEATLSQAQATLARDKAILENQRSLLNRNESLVKKGYTSKQDFDTLKSNVKSQLALIQADEAAVQQAVLQLAYTKILAPISGKTGNITLKLGSVIKANDTIPLVVINEIHPIYVSFTLQQQFLPALHERLLKGKLAVTAKINAKQTEEGELVFVDNTINTQTGNVELKASFANERQMLWPGQFVTVELTVEHRKDALLIPSLALMTGQNGIYVYVIDKANVAHVKKIKPGPSIGQETLVDEGLSAGDLVVTSGQLQLQQGSTVAIPAKG